MEPQGAPGQPQGAPQCHSAGATVPQCHDEITNSPHLSQYNSEDEHELEQEIREQKRRARRKQTRPRRGAPPPPPPPQKKKKKSGGGGEVNFKN